ncbi:MAG: HrgA protein [Acidobacteriota bacterium]|nr:HrgA protein [Acidobacteriota bacterium]
MAIELAKKVLAWLKEHPNQHFKTRQIAMGVLAAWPEDFQEKRANPRFEDDTAFLVQIIAEISAQKERILKDPAVQIRSSPRPRVYMYVDEARREKPQAASETPGTATPEVAPEPMKTKHYSEHDLYPLLAQFVFSEWHVHTLRIDEKRSRNSKGAGGNHWLHADVVGLAMLDKEWETVVRQCVHAGTGHQSKIYSFEVKKALTGGNVRESFFQAVSNSSWAHEGYLVAAEVDMDKVGKELSMLSSLHGIGVLQLDVASPEESLVLLPARERQAVDWESANRIAAENPDFVTFLEAIHAYTTSGKLVSADWLMKG